jgi:hypothetical protein
VLAVRYNSQSFSGGWLRERCDEAELHHRGDAKGGGGEKIEAAKRKAEAAIDPTPWRPERLFNCA